MGLMGHGRACLPGVRRLGACLAPANSQTSRALSPSHPRSRRASNTASGAEAPQVPAPTLVLAESGPRPMAGSLCRFAQ